MCSSNTPPHKICIFAPRVYPYFNPNRQALLGGAELQLYFFATELAKDQDFEASIVLKDMDNDREVREKVILHNTKIPEGGGSKYLKIPLIVKNLFYAWRKIDADIYVQRGATYQTGLVALFCRLTGKKFLYMAAHDGDTNRLLNPYRSGFIRKLFWWVYEFGMKRADAIIVQNERQARDLKLNYGRASTMRMSAHRIPKDAGLQEKDTILWVARGEDWKRPEVFVDLAEAFPQAKFVMIMPRSPRYATYWDEIRSRASHVPNIEFHEFVPPNEIEGYFAKAKVFVNTSTHEGFPNTFIQAAKMRTPILSLSVNPNDLIQKYDLGIFAEGSAEKLKQGLETLLRDQTAWSRLSENAFAYAKANHDIEKIIEDDKKILRSLLEPGLQPPAQI